MKNEKGITLISVTIYVIVMAIVVGIIAVISGFFYNSIENANQVIPAEEYTQFNRFFSNELNTSGIKVLACNSTYVVFSNDTEYTFVAENKGVYRNGVKICREVERCVFTKGKQNGKTTITVEMNIGGRTMSTTYGLQS